MNEGKSDPQIKLITWNVEKSSINRLSKQLSALQERTPDIIALQEFGVKASRNPRVHLRNHGFEYTAHSHEFHRDIGANTSGVAFASRWPFRVLTPETFDIPASHQALSAEFFTPFGRVEGHTVHILPGSMVGETKIEMMEGIYEQLTSAENPPDYRFLCGDFNSPKAESADGETVVWGSDERWKTAERNIIVNLAEHDMADAYRTVNEYGDDAYSFVTRNQGNEWRRRFDHVFASEALNATAATYLHRYDDLSDHTPLEVVFTPTGGLKSSHTTPLERTEFTEEDCSPESQENSQSVLSYEAITFTEDIRMVDPDQNYRLGRFKAGWNNAVAGTQLDSDVLDELTWQNLGWRLGKLLGETSEDHKEALYEWCVQQQLEQVNE